MKFEAIEKRMITYYLTQSIKQEKEKLKSMDEDTDEYMELANDLMVLDSIVSKFKSEKP